MNLKEANELAKSIQTGRAAFKPGQGARSESEGLKRLQTDFVYDFKENNYVESKGAIE